VKNTRNAPNGKREIRCARLAADGGRTARATAENTGATATGANRLMPLAFLDRWNRISRIQFAPLVRVSNFVNFVNSVGNFFGTNANVLIKANSD
jgi:hypothetical protein